MAVAALRLPSEASEAVLLELLRFIIKLKKRLRKELSREDYEKVVRILNEYQMWIEEQLGQDAVF